MAKIKGVAGTFNEKGTINVISHNEIETDKEQEKKRTEARGDKE